MTPTLLTSKVPKLKTADAPPQKAALLHRPANKTRGVNGREQRGPPGPRNSSSNDYPPPLKSETTTDDRPLTHTPHHSNQTQPDLFFFYFLWGFGLPPPLSLVFSLGVKVSGWGAQKNTQVEEPAGGRYVKKKGSLEVLSPQKRRFRFLSILRALCFPHWLGFVEFVEQGRGGRVVLHLHLNRWNRNGRTTVARLSCVWNNDRPKLWFPTDPIPPYQCQHREAVPALCPCG